MECCGVLAPKGQGLHYTPVDFMAVLVVYLGLCHDDVILKLTALGIKPGYAFRLSTIPTFVNELFDVKFNERTISKWTVYICKII